MFYNGVPARELYQKGTCVMPKRKPRRKRGGQPGNRNAYKHGFYSRRLTEEDKLYCLAGKAEGLPNAVAIMRGRMIAALRQDPGNYRVIRETARALAYHYRARGEASDEELAAFRKMMDDIVAQVRGMSPGRATNRG